jgi:hypothetical protein
MTSSADDVVLVWIREGTMRRAAYTVSTLIGCALVATLHAQDGNVFKQEDLHQLRNTLLLKVYRFSGALVLPTDPSGRMSSKEELCGRMLDKRLSGIILKLERVEELILISALMRSKEDEATVNRRLKIAVSGAEAYCPKFSKEAVENCASEVYLNRKVQEMTQLCAEFAALLKGFGDRVKNY